VVSDQGAIHDAAASINAGCDIEDGWGQYTQLVDLVNSGAVQEQVLDEALQRVFYVRFRHGEFDPPEMVPYMDQEKYGKFDADFYSNVSLQAAQQSIALLKNDDDFLPLSKEQGSVAVFGCLVREQRTGGRIYPDCQVAATAGYSTAPSKTDPPADALKKLGFDASFVESMAADDVEAAAAAADVAVVFLGRAGSEGESGDWCTARTCGDNDDLKVPPEQQTILDAVIASGTPTVLVFYTTNPLDIGAAVASGNVRAVLHAFYPEVWAGTAVADVLAGVVAPAGRMPYSWPTSLVDAGDIGDYVMTGTSKTYRFFKDDKTAPLFPFGYGLSYTSFSYADMSVSPEQAKPCESVTVSVTVTNTGDVDSDEVVQVYAQWRDAPLPAPQQQLVGFERVHVKAGDSVQVSLVLAPEQLALVDENAGDDGVPVWMAQPVTVDLFVGGQQPSQAVAAPSNTLAGQCAVVGKAVPLDECKQFGQVVV